MYLYIYFYDTDIDECIERGQAPCVGNARCENTQGSYRCVCPSGYVLSPDGRVCQGKYIKSVSKPLQHLYIIRSLMLELCFELKSVIEYGLMGLLYVVRDKF